MLHKLYLKQVEAWKERFACKEENCCNGKQMADHFKVSTLLLSRHKDTIELLEAIIKEVEEYNESIPCDCPKGGLVGENELPCDKCGGSQWVKRHICRFNDGEQNCECCESILSDLLTTLQAEKELIEKEI